MLGCHVEAAHIHDGEGLITILQKPTGLMKNVANIWADQIYQGEKLKKRVLEFGKKLEVVKRLPGRYRIYNEKWEAEWIPIQREFSILPKRWVVERTFAWFGRNRRLSKEYDYLPHTNWLYLAMVRLLCQRLVLNKLLI